MRKKIQVVLGILLGGALIWFLFRETDWAKVAVAIREADSGLLFLTFLVILFSFVIRVKRWSYIVRTAGPVSFRAMFSATQIGFLGNFVLPARAGEAIRALVLSRLERIPFSKSLAFVALDRVTDLFGLLFVLLVAVLAFRPEQDLTLPPEIYEGTISVTAIRTFTLVTVSMIFILISCFVLLYVRIEWFKSVNNGLLRWMAAKLNDRMNGMLNRLADRTNRMLSHFAEGMHIFRSAGDMAWALFFSLLTWLVGVFSYVLLYAAFDLATPWYASFVTIALLSVAISLPGAPGFVGQFHIAVAGALLLVAPSSSLDVAKAVAIMAHLLNLVAVAGVGVGCLYFEKFGLLELRRQVETVEDQAAEP